MKKYTLTVLTLMTLSSSAFASTMTCKLSGPDSQLSTLLMEVALEIGSPSDSQEHRVDASKAISIDGVEGTLVMRATSKYVSGQVQPSLDVGAFFYSKEDQLKPNCPYSKIAIRAQGAPIINPYDTTTRMFWIAGMGGSIDCKLQ